MKIFLNQIFGLFSAKDWREILLLLIFVVFSALMDAVGIVSLMPFIALVAQPNLINDNVYMKNIYDIFQNFGYEGKDSFLIFIGISVFILLTLTSCLKTLTMYFQIKFSALQEHSLSQRMLSRFVSQRYSQYVKKTSFELEQVALSEANLLVGQLIMPLLTFISQLCLVFFIMFALILVDWKTSVIVLSVVSAFYTLIFYSLLGIRARIAKIRVFSNTQRFKFVSEIFNAFKVIKVMNKEDFYLNRFENASNTYARSRALALSIGAVPKHMLELIGFGGLILLIIFLLRAGEDINTVLPIITLYAVAGYRLLPAAQQIYQSLSDIKGSHVSLDRIHKALTDSEHEPLIQNSKSVDIFDNSLELKNVSYFYSNDERPALHDVTLSIPAGSVVGLVGTTGSGKSTVIDILLGLLEPQTGDFEIDGARLESSSVSSWQKMIGYVPQDIYLTDDTILQNIAFGEDKSEIDYDLVVKASKTAQIHDFITENTDNGYDTRVGERGVRLSGGQVQRIGIARALYKQPRVLILDEATSALDNGTEKLVINEIYSWCKEMTLIVVAHRLSTIQNCDKIYVFSNGSLIDQGDFISLTNTSDAFKFLKQ